MAYALTNEELICNWTGRFESWLNELLEERFRKGGKSGGRRDRLVRGLQTTLGYGESLASL